MIIKTPQVYINEPDIINEAGKYIKQYSKKPIIIGGKSALQVTLEALKKSLKENDVAIKYIDTFLGFPSENKFNYYADIVKKYEADAIIAIGGGRVLDTAKATADLLDIPVITIPTIAATCAAWAGLTIQYDDEGAYVKARPLKRAPSLIIADTKIILSAPERYLFAGAVDTFAKFYEIRPSFEHAKNAVNLDIALYASRIAYDKLEKNIFKAILEAKDGIYEQSAKDVVDAIIYLAGFAGSFQTNTGYYSFAHPFYHISSRFPNTRHRLHGEKVAYGILAQLFLEKKERAYIEAIIETFMKYNNAFTLEDIGLNRDDNKELEAIAADIKESFEYVEWSKEDIIEGLRAADLLVGKIRK